MVGFVMIVIILSMCIAIVDFQPTILDNNTDN